MTCDTVTSDVLKSGCLFGHEPLTERRDRCGHHNGTVPPGRVSANTGLMCYAIHRRSEGNSERCRGMVAGAPIVQCEYALSHSCFAICIESKEFYKACVLVILSGLMLSYVGTAWRLRAALRLKMHARA
jgi:hypothetical protein